MKINFLTLNEPTVNGRVYTKRSLEEIPSELYALFGNDARYINSPSEIPLAQIAGRISNIHLDGDQIVGTLTVMATPMGKIIDQMLGAGTPIRYSASGIGSIDKDGNVSDYSFSYVNISQGS